MLTVQLLTELSAPEKKLNWKITFKIPGNSRQPWHFYQDGLSWHFYIVRLSVLMLQRPPGVQKYPAENFE